MRFTAAFGVFAMVAVVFAACGEDQDGSNAGGSGGNAGSGGGGRGGCSGVAVAPVCSPATGGTLGESGNAGTDPSDAGTGDGGTSSGGTSAADSDDAGTGDAAVGDASDTPSEPCTGCLELRASVSNNVDSAFFQIVYDTPVDMSEAGASISFRVSGLVPENQVRVAPFLYDSDYAYSPGEATELSAADGFIDIELPLDDLANGSFDNSSVIYVGLFVGYTGGIGAESSQDIAVLLDSVTFSGVDTPDLAFATDNEDFDRSEIGVQDTQVVHR